MTGRRSLSHQIDVLGRVKGFELFARRTARAAALHAPVEAAGMQLAHESLVPVRSERVTIAESIAGDFVAGDEEDGGGHKKGCRP